MISAATSACTLISALKGGEGWARGWRTIVVHEAPAQEVEAAVHARLLRRRARAHHPLVGQQRHEPLRAHALAAAGTTAQQQEEADLLEPACAKKESSSLI